MMNSILVKEIHTTHALMMILQIKATLTNKYCELTLLMCG